jgi:hypothetical protein
MPTYQKINRSTSSQIIPKQLLVSSMEFATLILPCSLLLVVEICDAIYTKRFLVCEEL